MARKNTPHPAVHTHEGAKAKHINPEQQLRRSVMACLLWESQFYEDGEDIAKRIADLIPKVDPQKVADIAIEARTKMKLRHVPLLIVREMAKNPQHKALVAKTLDKIIQRADELSEFLAIYWGDKKQPLSGQVKKGLAAAFTKFDEYQLAKYNRDNQVKLRDVLFLCHAKPKDEAQDALWKKLIANELAVPDTWEVALSATDGLPKKEKWERLLKENRLGAMALLRNLRNMNMEDADESLVIAALRNIKPEKVLPFRFIASARYAPQWESYLEDGMMKCLSTQEKLKGKTVLLVDVSSSMNIRLSSKSDMTRIDAACGLSILAREVCESVYVFTFSMKLVQIPARRGFALRDAIVNSQEHSGTPLGLAVECIYADKRKKTTKLNFGQYGEHPVSYQGQNLRPDRLIVITDEQSADPVPAPIGKGYMINVASYQNGVGYSAWTHIDGWSEAIIDYIRESEGYGKPCD
jgi:hypothetical protein